jgi:hypothetical protein
MKPGSLVPEAYLINIWPSALKRLTRRMCQPCISGQHQDCPTPDCPCLCNDKKWLAKVPEKSAA